MSAYTSSLTSNGLFGNGTYGTDIVLFKRLGLKQFRNIPHGAPHFVGDVVTDCGSVKVTVTAWPAQFWRFEITSKEAKNLTVLETGSGGLAAYWPIVEKILDGMVVVESVATA